MAKRQAMMAMMQGDKQSSNYTLQAQYAHIDPKNPQEADFIMFANMESSGKLQTVFGKNFGKWIHTRVTNFFPNSDFNMAQNQFEVEIEGKNANYNIGFDSQSTSAS